jgi:hypothetical protein
LKKEAEVLLRFFLFYGANKNLMAQQPAANWILALQLGLQVTCNFSHKSDNKYRTD